MNGSVNEVIEVPDGYPELKPTTNDRPEVGVTTTRGRKTSRGDSSGIPGFVSLSTWEPWMTVPTWTDWRILVSLKSSSYTTRLIPVRFLSLTLLVQPSFLFHCILFEIYQKLEPPFNLNGSLKLFSFSTNPGFGQFNFINPNPRHFRSEVPGVTKKGDYKSRKILK